MKLENGWIKFFSDVTLETGLDKDVRAGKASWQHGRLDGLIMVGLRHNNTTVFLSASEGNWWQSDTMVSKFRGAGRAGETNYITRRLEYQISERDIGKHVSIDTDVETNDTIINISSALPAPGNKEREAVRLSHQHIGKWLYVSLDIRSDTATVSFHDKKK
jgi:hypothetical protein